jgi:hypothetical protein
MSRVRDSEHKQSETVRVALAMHEREMVRRGLLAEGDSSWQDTLGRSRLWRSRPMGNGLHGDLGARLIKVCEVKRCLKSSRELGSAVGSCLKFRAFRDIETPGQHTPSTP